MLAPLLMIWPLSVALTWLVAQGIANRPYDRELAELTRTLAHEVAGEFASGRPMQGAPMVRRLERTATQLVRVEDEGPVYFQLIGPRGELLAGESSLHVPALEDRPDNVVRYRDDVVREEPVRVAYVWLPIGTPGNERSALVQVAEGLDKRSQLATEIARGVILSQLLILPLAVLLVWFALVRGLAPLDALQRRIRRRDIGDLSPIDEREAPEEVGPLVGAINDLLARLDRSMATQKHFLADAAHQLKTPLAGLRSQAELAQREIDAGTGDPQSMKRSLQQIARSSQRAAHMVNQLLAMAHAEDKEQARRKQDINLVRLATETVRDLVPRALDKGLDLGYEGPSASDAPVRLHGQPVLVRELIRNLVDNALQYTPRGGVVTVRVLADPFGQVAVLQVEDNGPGIAEAERELVFQPFYRALGTGVDGSGLGLAIVREIAAQHAAEVLIEETHPRAVPPGTRFTVRFPTAAR